MVYILTILHYFLAAVVDGLDKFLISKRKIFPASYTFWTIVTGVVVLVAWPFVYQGLKAESIGLDLASGALFSLVLYVFFKAIAQGEVSRVVPFVFGLAPVFDIIIGLVTARNQLDLKELAAMFLLLPGAILISYNKGFWGKHVATKILSAFLWSAYFALWQYAAQNGNTLNHFMWNRVGAVGVLILALAVPVFRKNALKHQHIENKKNTAGLFLFKQAIGGTNLIFFSWLLVVGKIPVINALQGLRYAFLFLGALFLSKKMKHILHEDTGQGIIWQKLGALALIFLGTLFLFL
ncbi:MAG: EamA family transporter [Candidatus Doudnabacteria bacterium]|nr:EamA family transporter [Candidatus Doudnabacteria bacterium]